MRRRLLTLLSALHLLWLVIAAMPALAARLPADSGSVNVRDFGARGDGKTDDTKAIRAAISAAHTEQAKTFWPARAVYFPAGTYRISDSLYNRDRAGLYDSSMALIGESAATVRLKLDDELESYGHADKPKAVIFSSSKLFDGTPTSGGKNYLEKGEGNDAYGNYVEDMTIDVGRGNPGAVAIDYLASNVGAIRHVAIHAGKGSGATAISLDRKWPGPLLLADISIDGFAVGISVSQPEYSVTMEDLRLTRQSEVGIRNNGNSVSMRGVSITSDAVALQNMGAAGLIVADRLSIHSAHADAVWVENKGYLTLKNVTLSSPKRTEGGKGLQGGESGAYLGDDRLSGFDAAWKITPVAAPAAFDPPLSAWVNVTSYGVHPDSGEDASPAIRKAFASGAALIYFPSGHYQISEPIDVPASVRRIVGMYSSLMVTARRADGFAREMGMFRVRSGGEPLTIEKIALDNTDRGNQMGIEHSGARSLVLRDLITAGTGFIRTSSGGRLFLENTCCGTLDVAGTEGIWARQFNTEGPATRIVNHGSPLSVLGIKTEQNCTVVENRSGADTEILGGLIYQVRPAAVQKPAFINEDGAKLVVSYTEEAYAPGSNYQEHVVQGDPQHSRSALTADRLPLRGKLARVMPGLGFPNAMISDPPTPP